MTQNNYILIFLSGLACLGMSSCKTYIGVMPNALWFIVISDRFPNSFLEFLWITSFYAYPALLVVSILGLFIYTERTWMIPFAILLAIINLAGFVSLCLDAGNENGLPIIGSSFGVLILILSYFFGIKKTLQKCKQ